jgi:hypothetical protein
MCSDEKNQRQNFSCQCPFKATYLEQKNEQESEKICTTITIFLGCLHNLGVEQVAGDSGYVCYTRCGHWSGPYARFMLTLVVNLET